MTTPRLALTPGDPGGVGPDLCLNLAQRHLSAQLVVVADQQLLADRAAQLGLSIELHPWQPGMQAHHQPGHLFVWQVAKATDLTPGQSNPSNAAYVLETITRATQACAQAQFDALVTGPIHKASINQAGIPFSGHTEFIAGLTGGTPVMLLTTPGLRVALATTHIPLSEVCRAITAEGLKQTLRILDHDLRHRFGIAQPRILVAGINPHAGEAGHLGREEIEIITPAIRELQGEHINLAGPLPADTLFLPPILAGADAILAMYHDQGLPVLKHIGFGKAVNITLGLPIIRTSVDHGTALELAGTGKADPGSLAAAIDAAIDLIQRSTP